MMSKKSPYQYGIPYLYSDACTCMIILRIWFITYIHWYNLIIQFVWFNFAVVCVNSIIFVKYHA